MTKDVASVAARLARLERLLRQPTLPKGVHEYTRPWADELAAVRVRQEAMERVVMDVVAVLEELDEKGSVTAMSESRVSIELTAQEVAPELAGRLRTSLAGAPEDSDG